MQVRFQMARAKKPFGRCEKTKKMLHVSRKDAASLEKRRSVVLKKTERCLKNDAKAPENRPICVQKAMVGRFYFLYQHKILTRICTNNSQADAAFIARAAYL